jgi:threonine aldolase
MTGADRFFASDNAAGVHPAILDAIAAANGGHALAYGHDRWTERAARQVSDALGGAADVLFVFGGSGANVVALGALVESHGAVLCAESSHLWRDECAAPERFLGCKLMPIPAADGKLTPDLVQARLRGFGVVHHAQPRAISVAQPTEWGTLYTAGELRALADLAHRHGMVLHVDGARLTNAAAALGVPLRALAADARVDVLSLGGTKAGLLAGEAVVWFGGEATGRAEYVRKQAMQLPSKLRYVAAQFEALLAGELWRTVATHANAMAARLGAAIADLPGVTLAQPVQTNVVFAGVPSDRIARLQREAGYFHVWDPDRAIVRLMTAWDTSPDDVDAFARAAGGVLSAR